MAVPIVLIQGILYLLADVHAESTVTRLPVVPKCMGPNNLTMVERRTLALNIHDHMSRRVTAAVSSVSRVQKRCAQHPTFKFHVFKHESLKIAVNRKARL
ncbi:hypothetical protein ANCCAN_02904 [Ancylostoma caninum]|uniref:Secreted protein n=1 Tax=Ancylostoma caninum TaxID=29170 RepID=A0A368H2R1_ANCCA|nr:hypothetical protein ANCCAN_02904 [Ancylostoma caninum]